MPVVVGVLEAMQGGCKQAVVIPEVIGCLNTRSVEIQFVTLYQAQSLGLQCFQKQATIKSVEPLTQNFACGRQIEGGGNGRGFIDNVRGY